MDIFNSSYNSMFQQNSDKERKMMGWNLIAEERDLMHSHWSQFEAPPYFAHLLLALVYFILMVCSCTGNGLVLWIFTTSRKLRASASNLLILNLAFFDMLMMMEIPLFLVNSFSEKLQGNKTGCNIYAALGSLSGMGGAITNAAIAYDRYRAISRPLKARLSRPQAVLFIIFTWFWAIPFTVMPWIGVWGKFVPEGYLTTCSFDYLTDDIDTKVFVVAIFVWAYCIPILFICIYYMKLFLHVRAHEKMLADQAKKMKIKSLAANKDENAQSVEIRIAKAAFTIFFLFILAWTPYAVVAIIGAFGDRSLLTPINTMLPAVFAKTVSCIDPWVYAASHPRYREELSRRLPWMGISETTPDADSNASDCRTLPVQEI